MLSESMTYTTIPVTDLERAQRFYGETLRMARRWSPRAASCTPRAGPGSSFIAGLDADRLGQLSSCGGRLPLRDQLPALPHVLPVMV